jgi:hypothetical protein
MRGPIPRARGPIVLSDHHGPTPLLHSELLRSSASGRSGARGHWLRVRGGGGGVGEPFGGLSLHWRAVRRRHDEEGWRRPEFGSGGALERLGEGEGWHRSGILGVLYIGRGDEVRGRGRKISGRRWVLNTDRFEIEKEREGRRSGAA